MFRKKINHISDNLHGSVQISGLEKRIISTQVFNRLHHVLQNSTAYLTFPTNKTSRFSHSIGVMHLGGEMLRFSIINGEENPIKNMLNYVLTYLKGLSSETSFQREIEEPLFKTGKEYARSFDELITGEFDDPFYKANTPFLISDDLIYPYIVVYQSLRLAALLHDLGHPPFSHITEDALDSIYAKIQSKKDKQFKLTKRQEQYYSILEEYKKSDDKLHEKLSKHLVEHVFSSVIKNTPNNPANKKKITFYLHVKYVTLAILNDSSPKFKEVHRLVDGVIDCDRLDYVSRDPLASGVDEGTIEYGRILRTMKIAEDQSTEFKFCYSNSVMNTIEDYFHRRWRMYKNIIFHHRVVKTDLLLNQTIQSLALEYLENDEDEKNADEENDFTIPSDISGLWKTVGKSFNLTQSDYINHFIQWDDSWLLSCLRKEYFKRKHNEQDDIVSIQLEELLSNKKYYFPLYKRFDGFLSLDLKLLEQFDTESLNTLRHKSELTRFLDIIEKYKELFNENKDDKEYLESLAPKHGLFFIAIIELFGAIGKEKEFSGILEEVLEEVKSKHSNISDVIFKRNKLSTGINDERLIYDHSSIKSIQDFSRIEIDLKSNKGIFPPYFVYVYANGEISNNELEDIKKDVGQVVAEKVNGFLLQLGGA